MSIDTHKAEVARARARSRRRIVNDVWGLQRDPRMAAVVASAACRGRDAQPRDDRRAIDIDRRHPRFFDALARRRAAGRRAGRRIVLDPGIGFGKTLGRASRPLRRCPTSARSASRCSLGVSRKSVLRPPSSNTAPARERLFGHRSRAPHGVAPAPTSCACTTSPRMSGACRLAAPSGARAGERPHHHRATRKVPPPVTASSPRRGSLGQRFYARLTAHLDLRAAGRGQRRLWSRRSDTTRSRARRSRPSTAEALFKLIEAARRVDRRKPPSQRSRRSRRSTVEIRKPRRRSPPSSLASPSHYEAAAVAEALLGLGSNLGDKSRCDDRRRPRPRSTLGPGILTQRSGFYRTPPWGVPDQPDFVNLCAAAETALSPQRLALILPHRGGSRPRAPRALGAAPDRHRHPDLWRRGGGRARAHHPHPRLTERAFVLAPLAEIAADVAIAGKTVRAWAEAIDRSGVSPSGLPAA